jgi:Flp pilus assembly CpaE family ATPase
LILLLTENQEEIKNLAYALDEEIQPSFKMNEVLGTLKADTTIDIVIVSSSIEMKNSVEVVEAIRLEHPLVSVILLQSRVDLKLLQTAIKSGFKDVILESDMAALITTISESRNFLMQYQLAQQTTNLQNDSGKVIIVFSAKGGCGKTTVSINLASSLAENTKKKICLVDFDLQFGDVAIALHIEPVKTISNAIAMGTNIDDLGVLSLMIKKSENLDLLCAPTNPTDVEFVTSKLVSGIISHLRKNYDFVIIDTPPAFTDWIMEAFDLSDYCYLLTTLDMPAIKNLATVKNTLDLLNYPESKRSYLLNKADSMTGISSKEAEKLLGIKFSGRIPNSPEVSVSTNLGQSLVTLEPNDAVSVEINRIATELDKKYFGSKQISEQRQFWKKK